jgi:hypothetical protein
MGMGIYLKALLFLIIFCILHYAYDLTHWGFLTPFCGVEENVFQHLKMAFWSYFFVSLIEYFIVERKLGRKFFWYPRLLSTITVPWFAILIWYLVPALYGKVESLILEAMWAIFATYSSGLIGAIVERNMEIASKFRSEFKIAVLILFVISAFLYVWFTYNPPWIDLFTSPEARAVASR